MSASAQSEAARLAELAARRSYGRLAAWLAAQFRDVALAEDALGDAFRTALERWPVTGPPQNPEAWLAAAARRTLLDAKRREATAARLAPALALLEEERAAEAGASDRRLVLMAAAAHPVVEPTLRAPLMLQVVLGFEASELASAHLVSPAAMAQRLVRAKRRLRSADAAFEAPEEIGPDRLGAVLQAIYTAFGLAWNERFVDEEGATRERGRDLAEEAILLGRLVAEQRPESAEAEGLLALMLFAHARRRARRDEAGRFVPLEDQDPALWDDAAMTEADARLARAGAIPGAGRFQLEAAIQSLHALRRRGGATDWRAISLLYQALLAIAPSAGALAGAAAAMARDAGAEPALALLDGAADPALERYQPYWATRAELLARLGREEAAGEAYARAIGLTEDPSVRAFLIERAAAAQLS